MPLMRIGQASTYTGLSAQKLRKLVDDGTIKAKKIGKQRFFTEEELDRFLSIN